MSNEGSVTRWIGEVKQGDEAAAQQLWKRYYQRLIGLARTKLRASKRRVADEEDVVLDAMNSFYRRAKQGRFPQLSDRHELWRLLVVVTARKASNQLKKEKGVVRGGGQVHGESFFQTPRGDDALAGIAHVIGDEPTPEFANQVAESYQQLLDTLNDDALRDIAIWKMEGYTNQEIADKIGRNVRSVERKLHLIRKCWLGQ